MYQVYVKGYVGNLGTKVLIEHEFDRLAKYFDASYLLKVKECVNGGSNPPLFIACRGEHCEPAVKKSCVVDIEEINKGGFLASLWKICDSNKCGLRYDLTKVPILQGTIEICNYLDINPYRLLTSDAEIIFTDCKDEHDECGDEYAPVCLIGETTNDKKRIRIDNEMESYLTKDFKDEIDRIIPNYTKKNNRV